MPRDTATSPVCTPQRPASGELLIEDSLTELAKLAGRNKSNLSRTLKTMSRYGLVELTEGQRGTLVPRVPYDQVRLDVALTPTSPGPA